LTGNWSANSKYQVASKSIQIWTDVTFPLCIYLCTVMNTTQYKSSDAGSCSSGTYNVGHGYVIQQTGKRKSNS
jgi:hypothetical protein